MRRTAVFLLLLASCGDSDERRAFDGDVRLLGLWVRAESDDAGRTNTDGFLLFRRDGQLEQYDGRDVYVRPFRSVGTTIEFTLDEDVGPLVFSYRLESEELTLEREQGPRPWKGTFRRLALSESLVEAASNLRSLGDKFVYHLRMKALELARKHSPGKALSVDVTSTMEAHRAVGTLRLDLSPRDEQGTQDTVRFELTFVRQSGSWLLVRARMATSPSEHPEWRTLISPREEGGLEIHTESGKFAMLVWESWRKIASPQ